MDDVRGTVLRLEIEARLRPVCADWPEQMFQALVSRALEITVKYEQGGGNTELIPDTRIIDAFVAEMKDLASRSAEVREELPSPAPRPDEPSDHTTPTA